jgi:hypothetical protein
MASQMRKQSDKSLRQLIIEIIDSKLDNPDLDKIPQDVILWFNKMINGEDSFSIESIVFGGFLIEVMTTEEPSELRALRQELEGHQPYWNTYVAKHRFLDLLQGDMLQAYETLQSLYHLLVEKCSQGADDSYSPEALEKQELYRDTLSTLVYNNLKPETIYELLLTQACQALISLPYYYPVRFNPADEDNIFSTLHVPEHVVQLLDYLEHTKAALMKIQGAEPLFIDVHLLADGYFLSIR